MNRIGSINCILALAVLCNVHASAQGRLDTCAEQFIGGTVSNAPTILNSPPEEPFGSNRHLCYRDDGVSFYAAEYWPQEFAPRWAAYKLSPEHYGANGCHTYTRQTANCYFQENTWSGFQACKKARDPFHRDHILTDD